jgi:hypothetical protein
VHIRRSDVDLGEGRGEERSEATEEAANGDKVFNERRATMPPVQSPAPGMAVRSSTSSSVHRASIH